MRVIIAVAVAAAIGIAFAGYFAYTWLSRPQYALEVDATRDTTDISGTLYRIRVANVGLERLTNISAEMGAGDIQTKDFLDPGQTYYFYPNPDTLVPTIKVTSGEGIKVVTDYRTPTKVLGLPGGGR
ncbi:hypothetical protein [Nitrososphaera viennensis]|uniref:Uncharacterized protein n=2 Tax=Nitrososphaera viennensis TaxID=1034015 RepID=A0A060HC26_9ARCH|nr:hypothetical protein [Nitrososphaera viennensis]AIC14329.1 hypothetical protein NVIE_0148 [Nitrososphaera viennensis EN76]UVS69321.1 hypothetical protein NWT39_00700 [Nitrososphaera viennensis]